MVVTNWLRLFRGRMWYQSRRARTPRKRRRPIGLAQRIELFEDRTLLSAVAIDGLTHEMAGQAADMRHARGKDAEMRAAERRRNSQALPLGNHDVGAAGADTRRAATQRGRTPQP